MSRIVRWYDAEVIEEGGENVSASVSLDVDLELRAFSNAAAIRYAMNFVQDVPVQGDAWSTTDPNLWLMARRGKVFRGGSNVGVKIDCDYRLLAFADTVPEAGHFTLEQIETYRDRFGNPFSVSYSGDTQYVSATVPIFKSAWTEEIALAFPASPVSAADRINVKCGYMANALNSTLFRGWVAGTVLCTNIDYERIARFGPIGAKTTWYLLRADFEAKDSADAWKYPATYKNPDGTSPPVTTPDVQTLVEWHKSFDFNLVFLNERA